MPVLASTLFSTDAKPSVLTSLLVMLTLCVIFAACWMMFWILVERSTLRRHWVAMVEWGREHKLAAHQQLEDKPPAPFDAVSRQRLVVRSCLENRKTKLLQLESFGAITDAPPGDHATRAGMWSLLVLTDLKSAWPPTGLRPAIAATSALDLFSLASFPLLGSTERFVLFGTDDLAAAALSRSGCGGLLPPDVGLLLHGRHLVIDFSSRPFDTIEFERMLAVAAQIVTHLPAV